MGTPTGAFLFAMTNNLAAGTWVWARGKHPTCSVPKASRSSWGSSLQTSAPVVLDCAHDGNSSLGVQLKPSTGLMPAPSQQAQPQEGLQGGV